MSEQIKVRTPSALMSPFVSIGREFGDIFRNPTALIGGVLGSTSFLGAVVAFVMFGPKLEGTAAAEDDELVMEFMPGELMRKGPQMNPEDIPEKIIVEETVAAEAKTEAKVTTDEKATPDPEVKKKNGEAQGRHQVDREAGPQQEGGEGGHQESGQEHALRRPADGQGAARATPSATRTAGRTWPRTGTRGRPR